MLRLINATTRQDLDIIRELFREYEKFLGFGLCFQGFENELAGLPGNYAPPEGRLIIAKYDSEAAGCIALKKIGEGVCEMKRLYVRPKFRGKKIGRQLAEKIIAEAKLIGYKKMRLDTLRRLNEAVTLYRSLSFREIQPYVFNPHEDAVYMEIDL